ncbi:hypothetical protein BKA57DRAFT_464127 [Linnemannia elongata]|nr:hypothetical protein BKA57DRAFT_464127 [Linnemannia elongata]
MATTAPTHATISSLPPELIAQIALRLRPADLLHCTLTNREWLLVFTPQLWRFITVDEFTHTLPTFSRINSALPTLQKFNASIACGGLVEKGHLVEGLHLGYYEVLELLGSPTSLSAGCGEGEEVEEGSGTAEKHHTDDNDDTDNKGSKSAKDENDSCDRQSTRKFKSMCTNLLRLHVGSGIDPADRNFGAIYSTTSSATTTTTTTTTARTPFAFGNAFAFGIASPASGATTPLFGSTSGSAGGTTANLGSMSGFGNTTTSGAGGNSFGSGAPTATSGVGASTSGLDASTSEFNASTSGFGGTSGSGGSGSGFGNSGSIGFGNGSISDLGTISSAGMGTLSSAGMGTLSSAGMGTLSSAGLGGTTSSFGSTASGFGSTTTGVGTGTSGFGGTTEFGGGTTSSFSASTSRSGSVTSGIGSSGFGNTSGSGSTSGFGGGTTTSFGDSSSSAGFGGTAFGLGSIASALESITSESGSTTPGFGSTTSGFGTTAGFGRATSASGSTISSFGGTTPGLSSTMSGFGSATIGVGAGTSGFGGSTGFGGGITSAFSTPTPGFGSSTSGTRTTSGFGSTSGFGGGTISGFGFSGSNTTLGPASASGFGNTAGFGTASGFGSNSGLGSIGATAPSVHGSESLTHNAPIPAPSTDPTPTVLSGSAFEATGVVTGAPFMTPLGTGSTVAPDDNRTSSILGGPPVDINTWRIKSSIPTQRHQLIDHPIDLSFLVLLLHQNNQLRQLSLKGRLLDFFGGVVGDLADVFSALPASLVSLRLNGFRGSSLNPMARLTSEQRKAIEEKEEKEEGGSSSRQRRRWSPPLPSPLPQLQTLHALRKIQILACRISDSLIVSLFERSPNLQSLRITACKGHVIHTDITTALRNSCPRLNELTLSGELGTDKDLARMISSSTAGWVTLAIPAKKPYLFDLYGPIHNEEPRSPFGSLSTAALLEHVSTLENLLMDKCPGFLSRDVHRLLCSAPRLRRLMLMSLSSQSGNGAHLHAHDLMDISSSKQQWACRSLEEFSCEIIGVPRPDMGLEVTTLVDPQSPHSLSALEASYVVHRKIYSRFAQLPHLSRLVLGKGQSGGASSVHSGSYLSMSLESGLNILGDLKELQTVDCDEFTTKFWTDPVQQWARNHWPQYNEKGDQSPPRFTFWQLAECWDTGVSVFNEPFHDRM